MVASPPFAPRLLAPHDLPQAVALAHATGAPGVYVGNYLLSGGRGEEAGELLGLFGAEHLLGLAHFGDRGNLIVIEREPLDGATVAAAIRATGFGWRIALAPLATVAALAAGEPRPPLVHRNQLYYRCTAADVTDLPVPGHLRLAERRDLARLLDAALALNEADLNVDPQRVHRTWLRAAIRRRARAGQTWVVDSGPSTPLRSKLDIGSEGPCGVMLEGVFTFPAERGKGLASALVAAVARRVSTGDATKVVCLHVAARNASARHAYEAAGMREAGECGLLLRS